MAYVTRERDGRIELLVFDQPADPEAGTQVPAGRLEAGESLEQGLLRELYEEAGIDDVEIVRELRVLGDWLDESPYQEHAFEVRSCGEPPDSWEHIVQGDGEDAGMIFSYRWLPIDSEIRLWRSWSDSTYTQLR